MKTTYYIESGALKEAVQADTPMEAAAGAFMRALEKEVPAFCTMTSCSVHGFISDIGDMREDDLYISTEHILRETGLIEKYSRKDLTIDE